MKSEVWAGLLTSSNTDPRAQHLANRVQQICFRTRELSSFNTYNGYWSRFVQFCGSLTPPRGALPALPETVSMFLADLGSICKTYAPIKLASAAIFTMHQLALMESPTKHPVCKATRHGLQRLFGCREVNRKEPLHSNTVKAIISITCFPTAPTYLLMLGCLTAVAFAGFFRYKDIVTIHTNHVSFFPTHMEILLVKRKNDQFRRGSVIGIARSNTEFCPVNLVTRLMTKLEFTTDMDRPLFPGYKGADVKGRQHKETPMFDKAITYDQARYQVLHLVSSVLGINFEDTKNRFGMHSLRSGGTTTAARSDIPEVDIQRHGGWKTPFCKNMYILPSDEQVLRVTQVLKL